MNKAKRGINLVFTFLFLLTASVCIISVKGIDVGNDSSAVNLKKTENTNEETDTFNIVYQTAEKSKKTVRNYLSVLGTPFGIKLYTKGVIVVGSESILTKDGFINPAEAAGLKQGDIITAVNEKPVKRNGELSKYLAESNGKKVVLTVIRDGKEIKVDFKAVLCDNDKRYKAGLWVRDSSAGIGTLSFYDEKLKMFCGLGHGVNDIDTGELVPLLEGEAIGADITGAYKGSQGVIGELIGVFNENIIGSIIENSTKGVYGFYDENTPDNGIIYPIAEKREVKTGKAQMISTIDENGPKLYDIEITKIDSGSSEKNLVINVTDASLIAKTGGIVQGMSGSPVIQDGMLVGVVTHVFVDNPKGGYGIFAETMYDEMTKLYEREMKNAA
ncbi:MAG: SpoIVB peptidase precursor [Firmicutes bacterium ADurb.Bin300]|nr:MAG: SpoIVB peptidase precursor [Firmicutes bacterium ADurb.Bin300]HOD03054.1 SpoIVB peptidase [Clostridiales bacterium]